MPNDSQATTTTEGVNGRTPKGWTTGTLEGLGVKRVGEHAFDFPIYNEAGEFAGAVRYWDDASRKPKADLGMKRDLFPRPEGVPGLVLDVAEGEADAVTLTELGFDAVGIPGTSA